MAEAFEALREHDRGVAQRVCVKRVLPSFVGDADFVRLFESEARVMATLAHGNIVGVLDVGEDDGTPYLVLELVDGIDLRALLLTAPAKRLDADVARYIAFELATALAHAHAADPPRRDHGIVHRDISPSNVLVARGGEVRLTDFGLAKAIAAQPVTQSGAVRGKIPYMSPEQMRGGSIDGRADLFSLGVMLFECLAGSRPFDGKQEVETMTRLLANTRTDLAELRPDLPPALVALVDRLLAPTREARFPDAHALLEALEALGPVRRGRLSLAKLVESRLGGARTRAHVSPHLYFGNDADAKPLPKEVTPLEAAHTEPEVVVEPATAEARKRIPRVVPPPPEHAPEPEPTVVVAPSRGPLLPLGMVLAFAVAGALFAFTRTPRTPPASPAREPVADAPIARERAATEPTATTTPPPPADVPEPSAPAPEPTPEPSDESVLRIVIEPWGKVWVDQQYLGRAPRVVPLTPGVSHLVEAGFDGKTHRRSVTLARGEHRTLRLDITPRE